MKIIILLYLAALWTGQALASEACFVAKENDKILVSEGDCNKQYTPQSTFKIALSLIGFDSLILKNEFEPNWSLPKGIDPYINICKKDHSPKTWMRDSCLWYSQILTTKLGMQKFQDYVIEFSYGNMDISGGLTKAWVSSSLKISPVEQTIFLQKIVDRKFPINSKSYDQTKKIMFIQELPAGWRLYGKTGNGQMIGKNQDLQHGWFVGYIEKENRHIVFANHIVDTKKQNIFASFRARNDTLTRLWYLINNLENK